MARLKTQKDDASVEGFLNSVENEKRRKDSFAVLDIMREIIGEEPSMWGTSIIGSGTCRYKYASGRDAEWFVTGFSPRKRNLTLYIMSGFDDYDSLLSDLGRYRTGKSCLYINKLEDVDLETLRELITHSVNHVAESSE